MGRIWGLVFILLLGCSGFAFEFDQYGGCTALSGNNASGFFRVERIGDRYWFITPQNHAFFALATCCTLYNGDFCPELGYYVVGYSNRAKYNNDRNAWATRTRERMEEYGYNTLGSWSDTIANIPRYNRVLHVTYRASNSGCRMVNWAFPDVWDPKFEEICDQTARSLVAPYADDPWIIGYFQDNEINWYGLYTARWTWPPGYYDRDIYQETGEQVPVPCLVDEFIALPREAYGKQRWVQFLQEKYGSLDALNSAWETSFTSWDGEEDTSLINCTELPPFITWMEDESTGVYENPRIKDKIEFMGLVAEQYYKVTCEAIRRYDPNHLILGDRLACWNIAYLDCPLHRKIWEAAGKYCDVVTINSYNIISMPNFAKAVFRASGKPVLIGEWASIRGDDTPYIPGWFDSQQQRARHHVEELKSLVNMQDEETGTYFMLGASWFQYYDQPPLGRPPGWPYGEHNQDGILNVKDEPYMTFVELVGEFQRHVYDYLIGGQEISFLPAPRPISPIFSTEEPIVTFQWEPVEGAVSYTLLLSPVRYFPGDGNTLKFEGIEGTSFTVPFPLSQGQWYWTVKAVDENGIGGYYAVTSSPDGRYGNISPYFEVVRRGDEDIASGFMCEELALWRKWGVIPLRYEIGDLENPDLAAGSSFALLDTQDKTEGNSSMRVVFTVHSYHKVLDDRNPATAEIPFLWDGGYLDLSTISQLQFDIKPSRVCNTEGDIVSAAKFLYLRIADEEGGVIYDGKIDETLPADTWSTVSIPLEGKRDKVNEFAFYIKAGEPLLPWDQRIEVRIDNIRIPAPVVDFRVEIVGEDMRLRWKNPNRSDFTYVRILHSLTGFPTSLDEGEIVYEGGGAPGQEMEFIHQGAACLGVNYYSIFAYYNDGAHSQPMYGMGGMSKKYLDRGWHLISLPVLQKERDAVALFDKTIDAGNELDGKLIQFGFILTSGTPVYYYYPYLYPDYTCINPGEGYWIFIEVPVMEDVVGVNEEALAPILLQDSGWRIIGYPYTKELPLSSCKIHYGETVYTLPEAVRQNLVYRYLYYYDGKYVAVDILDEEVCFQPWRGYWLCTLVDGLQIEFPKP